MAIILPLLLRRPLLLLLLCPVMASSAFVFALASAADVVGLNFCLCIDSRSKKFEALDLLLAGQKREEHAWRHSASKRGGHARSKKLRTALVLQILASVARGAQL